MGWVSPLSPATSQANIEKLPSARSRPMGHPTLYFRPLIVRPTNLQERVAAFLEDNPECPWDATVAKTVQSEDWRRRRP